MSRLLLVILRHLIFARTQQNIVHKDVQEGLHTDQYLHWDSHLQVTAKYSIINTLHHRDKAVSSTSELLRTNKEWLSEVLTKFKYPLWPLDMLEQENLPPKQQQQTQSIQGVYSYSIHVEP